MERRFFLASTVGTSILKHAGDAGIVEAGLDRLAPDDPKQIDVEKYPYEIIERIRKFIEKNPEKYSAELNTFIKFIKRYSGYFTLRVGRVEELRIRYYVTDTGTGKLVGRILEAIDHKALALEALGKSLELDVRVDFRVVEGLGRDFGRGLLGLVTAIAGDILDYRRGGYQAYLLATGGYKPETAFATAASMLVGVNAVIYIHESFKDVVIVPRIPLELRSEVSELINGRMSTLDFVKSLGYYDLVHAREEGLIEQEEPAPWLKKLHELIAASR